MLLIERAPARVVVLVGIALVLLGAFIVTRPLTSLWLLGVFVGVSAMASGIIDLARPRERPRWWDRAISVVWILGGAAILIWLGRSLDLLPQVLAVLLLAAGVGSLGDMRSGRVSKRVLAGAWGAAQLAFGALALLWPDVTLLVVAVLFGVRTIIFGATLVWRGGRRGASPRLRDEASAAKRRWADVGRYALSVLVLALAASSWAVNAWLGEGAPVIDAFYEPPSAVPLVAGELIRDDQYGGRLPSNGEVRRILYTTTDTYGRDAVASALVILPADPPPGHMPVVLWNHGTTGVARGCAPSLTDSAATKWAIPALDQALDRGWAVVAPDYTGQGAPGVFPYLIGQGEARSGLDAVRAAQGLEGAYLSDIVVAWGHSQGGHAALWEGQIAGEYAPDLDVRGVAALAPAGDPAALADELASPDASALLSVLVSWVLVPYAETYPDVDIDDYVAPAGQPLVREMTQRCLTEPGVVVSAITSLGVSADRPLFPVDLTTGALGARLEKNTPLGPWDVPLLVSWGARDEVIPPALQEDYVGRLCEAEADVRWMIYEAADHRGVLVPGSPFLPTLLRWSEARIAREAPLPTDCPG